VGWRVRQRRVKSKSFVLFCEGSGEGKEMIETIRLFPTVQASGYPDKHDLAQAKLEKQHEVNKTLEVAKQKQTELQDIGFEIYCKKVVQNRLRMEIFQNRKLDIYV
jgi:hypothetical protein